jgi:hypothetical protein
MTALFQNPPSHSQSSSQIHKVCLTTEIITVKPEMPPVHTYAKVTII